jgi:hypothetical protein
MAAWQLVHDEAAAPGSCGAWQLVQTACAGTTVAASVGLGPWQLTQTVTRSAVNSWGAWQVRQES